MKKIIVVSLILVAMGLLFLLPNSINQQEIIVDGYNGDMKVEVVLNNKRIEKINIIEHHETPGVSDNALIDFPNEIIEHQSLLVDTKTGVTVSCEAIKSAVSLAIIRAGLNVEDYLIPIINEEEIKPLITIEKDIIVIGAGGAGMAASAQANELGNSIAIIEKMPNYGGNTLIAGGTMNAVDPIRQGRQNISDSVELYIDQTYEYGGYKGDIDLIRILCENALDARNWLSSYGGKWSEVIYQTIGGLWPRSMNVETYGDTNSMYLEPLLTSVSSNENNELYLNTKATSFYMENNEVKGVYAKSTLDNQEYLFKANKGVILATGGYSANLDLIRTFNSNIPLNTSNDIQASGDGLMMVQQINGQLVGMEYIQIHPHGNPQTGKLQSEYAGEVDGSIYVNLEGQRFVNEQDTWSNISEAILNQSNKLMYSIYDSKQNIQNKQYAINQHIIIEANTIEELALKTGLDIKNLQDTINEYNDNIENDKFNKINAKKIDEAPYYACLMTPVYHYTMGGVKINEKAQVIDNNNEVIPHLYACGEVTGGIHGDNRLGGNSMTDNVVFGRIAAINADKE